MTRVLNLKATTELFLDTPKVIKQLNETERRTFTRMGGHIKTNAQRRQLKKRKTPSKAGAPPHVRSGEKERPSLKWILFFYDAKRHEVIVGPVGVSSKLDPGVLEKGGTVTSYRRYIKNARPRRRRRDPNQPKAKRRTPGTKPPTVRRKRPKKVRLAARPFMIRALNAEMPKLKPLMERL